MVNLSDKSFTVYFDTSVYNRLFDDSDKVALIEAIRNQKIIVLPSIVNLCELVQTRDSRRRKALIRLYEEIRGDLNPLKPYTWLLKESIQTNGEIAEELVLSFYIKINCRTKCLCEKIKSTRGITLENFIQRGRAFIQEFGTSGALRSEREYFSFLDSDLGSAIYRKLFDSLLNSLRIKTPLDLKSKDFLLHSLDHPWKYYLDSYAYLIYRRCYLDEGFGKRSNPGPADIEQCAYFFWPGRFVIEDPIFLQFARDLKKLRSYEIDILDYSGFKSLLC